MLTKIFGAALVAGALLTSAATAQTSNAAAIAAINTECNAIQDAVMALHPVRVAYRSGQWLVVSDAQYMAAEKVGASLTLADAYKQGSKFAWVQSHTFDSSGKQRATQLCFRQSDGTLERARQATTEPSLAAAAAEQAYYSSDGKLIQKTALFEQNDPMLAKKIAALPFFAVLPH
jgi:hypothetical protein